MNYTKVIQWVLVALGVVFLCLIGFGAYKFYFAKPVPNTQSFTIMPGANANITQSTINKKDQHLITSLYVGRADNGFEGGVSIGWLW